MSKALVLNGTDFSTNKVATITFGESVPCTGITLDQSTKSVTAMTDFTLVATPTPSNTTDSVVWSSSDETVVTVANGVVTPVGLGTATITATCGTQSATCAVTVDNVVPDFIVVSGYNPYRRSSTGSSMTTEKKSEATSGLCILADNKSTGLYTIESKTDVDTSPYRFVPVLIPSNATKIIVNTTIGNLKTRTMFIDSTKMQTQYDTGIGAYCLEGTTGTWDQGSTAAGPLEIAIPQNVEGLDSFCMGVAVGTAQTSHTDITNSFSVKFTYGE